MSRVPLGAMCLAVVVALGASAGTLVQIHRRVPQCGIWEDEVLAWFEAVPFLRFRIAHLPYHMELPPEYVSNPKEWKGPPSAEFAELCVDSTTIRRAYNLGMQPPRLIEEVFLGLVVGGLSAAALFGAARRLLRRRQGRRRGASAGSSNRS